MRLNFFINELSSIYGPGITFVDIDETLLVTDARVRVMKGGKLVARLRNWEFLEYKFASDETPDFSEYGDSELFYKTSKPIEKTIERIRRMFVNIGQRGSKVVILTARSDFDNKELFLATFKKFGLPIENIYVERLGSGGGGLAIPEKKKRGIFKYLATGLYRRARLIDDSSGNCRAFLELENELPQEVIDKVKERYRIPENDTLPPIQFFALQVQKDGSLKRIEKG